jgi:uncharacterized protein (DUF2252 family)
VTEPPTPARDTPTSPAAGGPRSPADRRLSMADRVQSGRAARGETPRSSHATFEAPPTRADPIELLERQAKTRVPELVPIRYGRMLASPFAFFRGAAMIMAHDLAATPRTGLTVQCCGDAHLSNFGVFASPERRLVFDLNDFDETLPGPWEWDVKRLATSMRIAAIENDFSAVEQERIVLGTVQAYRTLFRRFAQMTDLDVWYAHIDTEEAVTRFGSELTSDAVRWTEDGLARARARDSMSAFSKLTETVDGTPRIADRSPLIVPVRELAAELDPDAVAESLRGLLHAYSATLESDRRVLVERFELVDLARKVVGVGSVGTRTWIALMLGHDGREPLFLQIKEAERSVLEPLLAPSEFAHHGQRVVSGQRLMQASSDIFLGWLTVDPDPEGERRAYYVRQLKDWKGSATIEQMSATGMAAYGKLCGATLARAHARSGDRVAIAGYLGSGDVFDRAILDFSGAYAEQNERDYAALVQASSSGRITVRTGV